jgi:hypothetical protein
MNQDVLKRISDRTTSERDLRSAIKKLEGVTEPPSFWIDIANDRSYSAGHRAICICQYFKRHMREPISVACLAQLLDDPGWINPGSVTTVTHLKGEIPVQWNLGETVLAIRLFPGKTEDSTILYIRLSQSSEAEAFAQTMRASQNDATAVATTVREAACGGWGKA